MFDTVLTYHTNTPRHTQRMILMSIILSFGPVVAIAEGKGKDTIYVFEQLKLKFIQILRTCILYACKILMLIGNNNYVELILLVLYHSTRIHKHTVHIYTYPWKVYYSLPHH